MVKRQSVVAEMNVVQLDVAVSAAPGGVGQAVVTTQPSSSVTITNTSNGASLEYKAGDATWVRLLPRDGTELAVDVTVTALLLRRARYDGGLVSAQLIVAGKPSLSSAEGGLPISTGGVIEAVITGSRLVGEPLTATLPAGVIGTLQFTKTLLVSPFTKSNISTAAANAVNSLQYSPSQADLAYRIGCDASNTVTPSIGVTISTGPAPVGVPVFSAAPTLNMAPTSGSVLSLVGGTFTGAAQTETKTIYRDGIDVGDNYLVTQRDLQAQFQGVHIVRNAAGTVAAGTAIASGIQDTSLAPAFTTAGGIGLPANPYLMSTEVVAGHEVKLYTGTRTAGATVANGFEVAGSLAGPWAEDVSGTVRTSPYRGYKTVAGMAGKFMRGWIDLGGTGSNPQARYYTDPIPIVAPGIRSGEVVTVSSANRLALKGVARPNKTTKSITSYTHTVGSAPIDSIVLDLANIISDGAFSTTGSGFDRTFEAIDVVYQGVVYQPRFGGAVASPATPVVVPNGAVEYRNDPLTTITAFGASWPVIVPGEDILVRYKEAYVPNQIVPLTEGCDHPQFNTPTTFLDPATDTIVNDVGNTNAGNNYRTGATGPGVSNTGVGPSIMLLGTFANKDAVTVLGAGDSRRAAQANIGLHAPSYNRNIGKPPIANINLSISGSNVYFVAAGGYIQKYFKLCDTLVDGFGINNMQDVANAGNATSLINEAKAFWSLFKANASTGANRRAPRVFRTSLQFRFQATGTVTGGDSTVVAYSNTFQHLQPCYPKMDLGGDIQKYFVPAMLAEVASGNLAGYIEYRDRIALSRNPAEPGYYRTLPGRYGDGLHGGDGRVAAKLEYQMVVA